MTWRTPSIVLSGAVGIVAIGYLIALLPVGEREVAQLTNAQGMPFAPVEAGYQISQALAHFEVYLREPVLFKELQLSFSYLPLASTSLAVGVRENDSWLSYTPTVFYVADQVSGGEFQSANITIPLTDKLQATDRSIDVMFFANGQREESLLHEPNDSTLWYIRDIYAEVQYAWPTKAAFKDYVRAIITRERPL